MNDANAARKVFEAVMDRMVEVGWLHSYTFTAGKGFHLMWKPPGGVAAMELKVVQNDLCLGKSDERPVIASMLAFHQIPSPESNSKTMQGAYAPYVASGYADKALFLRGVGSEFVWTETGAMRMLTLKQHLETLAFGHDENRLIALFAIADGWAPDWETPVVQPKKRS
jgi:hypothetical protein